MQYIIIITASICVSFLSFFAGREREKRKTAEASLKTLKKLKANKYKSKKDVRETLKKGDF